MAKICVVTPCFNEEGNVVELHARLRQAFAQIPQHEFTHLFIDNASTDNTVGAIKEIISKDPRVGLIANARNFGHIRSPYHGLLQAEGDAVIVMASDLQEPPEIVPRLVEAWEKGFPAVKLVRTSTAEGFPMSWVRGLFYRFINSLAPVELTKNYTGSGMYDRRVLEIVREIGDPYPYFRGLISEIGVDFATVVYHQERRKSGISANNLFTLYDIAVLGITKHSRRPLRFMTFLGFVASLASVAIGFFFLMRKVLYWHQFEMGQAPIILGIFFTFSLQMMFMGIMGEYIGNIFIQLQKVPLVVEKERINAPRPLGVSIPSAVAPNEKAPGGARVDAPTPVPALATWSSEN